MTDFYFRKLIKTRNPDIPHYNFDAPEILQEIKIDGFITQVGNDWNLKTTNCRDLKVDSKGIKRIQVRVYGPNVKRINSFIEYMRSDKAKFVRSRIGFNADGSPRFRKYVQVHEQDCEFFRGGIKFSSLSEVPQLADECMKWDRAHGYNPFPPSPEYKLEELN